MIDRSTLNPVDAYYLDTHIDKRARNREAGRCVNETKGGTHGPATHGCRCRHCAIVHRYGAEMARKRADYVEIGNHQGER